MQLSHHPLAQGLSLSHSQGASQVLIILRSHWERILPGSGTWLLAGHRSSQAVARAVRSLRSWGAVPSTAHNMAAGFHQVNK